MRATFICLSLMAHASHHRAVAIFNRVIALQHQANHRLRWMGGCLCSARLAVEQVLWSKPLHRSDSPVEVKRSDGIEEDFSTVTQHALDDLVNCIIQGQRPLAAIGKQPVSFWTYIGRVFEIDLNQEG